MKTFNFANYYRDLRKRYSLTQHELAEIVGATQQGISIVERGNKEPGAGKLVKIFEKFPKEGGRFVKMIKEQNENHSSFSTKNKSDS